MFNRTGIFLFGVLLLLATACFAQSSTGQTIVLAAGSSVRLRANSIDAVNYQWKRNGSNLQGATDREYVVSLAGKYSVQTFSAGGCSDLSDEMEVVMAEGILADVSIVKKSETRQVLNHEIFKYYLMVRNNGPGNASAVHVKDVLPNNLVFESMEPPSDGTTSYDPISRTINWDIAHLSNGRFSELVIQVRPIKSGTIRNSATVKSNEHDPDPSNNTSIDTKEIRGLKIPNVFTPNGDGKNDTFFIEKLDTYTSNELTIINRWGGAVYQKEGYLNDWNANGLTDGTYFYVLKVKMTASDWQEFKGYVMVIH